MEKLFLEILNMSITGAYVILVVMVIRLFLKKVPKIFSYALWAVVFFRLICPFSFESTFSLMPMNTKPIAQGIVYEENPTIESGIKKIDDVINPYIPKPNKYDSANPLQIWNFIGVIVWIIGIIAMVTYTLFTTIKLYKNIKDSKHIRENIYELKSIGTPFVFGIIRPKIYIPRGLADDEMVYIIKHEETHIRRGDHIVKTLGFFVLVIHWFNPFVWVAFRLMEKDMELSCDERVIKELGNKIKKEYSTSLLALSTGKRMVTSPIAFGENGIKGRIKNVLNYKKPTFWIAAVVSIVIVIATIGLMSNPKIEEQDLSFLNPDNLISSMIDRDKIRVEIVGQKGYTYSTAESLSKWIDKTKWKETHKVSFQGFGPTYVIKEIMRSDVKSQISINYGNPIVATVDYDMKSRAYMISEEEFRELERIISESYFQPYDEEAYNIKSLNLSKYKDHKKGDEITLTDKNAIESIKELTLSGKLTSRDSINESPSIDNYIRLAINTAQGTSYCYLYEKKNKYYLEQPYMGIWEVSEEAFHEIIEISEKFGVVDESSSGNGRLIELSDFTYEGNDKILKLVYDTEISNFDGYRKEGGFMIPAIEVHGTYEEGNKLKVFITSYTDVFQLRDKSKVSKSSGIIATPNKEIKSVGGSIVPIAITYTKNENGVYSLEDYITAKDGELFYPSIEEYCTMPISGEKIVGLAEDILEKYGNHDNLNDIMIENLKQHLKVNGQKNVYLVDEETKHKLI